MRVGARSTARGSVGSRRGELVGASCRGRCGGLSSESSNLSSMYEAGPGREDYTRLNLLGVVLARDGSAEAVW